jgi:hypothetical protein
MQKRSFTRPEDVRQFEKGHVEVVKLGAVTFGRATLEPGWKWSQSLKPLAKTASCEIPHVQYHIAGRLHVVMDGGREEEFVAGDVSFIPPGHDAWVVGTEPVVVLDIAGLATYGKPQ